MGYSDAVQRSSRSYGVKKTPAPTGGRDGDLNERPKSTQTKGYPEYAGFSPNDVDEDEEYPGFKNRILAEGAPGSSGVVRETQVPAYSHVEEYGKGREVKSGSNGQTGRGAKLYGNVKSGNRP